MELTRSGRLSHLLPVGRELRRARIEFCGLAACFLFLCAAAPAQAEGTAEEAKRAFEEGVTLEKKGDYAGALDKFATSEKIKGTVGNRFHKAFCLEMVGRLAAALDEYDAVDKTAREQGKADVVEATRGRAEPLKARVPRLELRFASSLPQDAEVMLDGRILPAERRELPIFVDPGEHTVAARAPEHETFSKHFAAAEGATSTVDVSLQPQAPAPVGRRTSVVEPPLEPHHAPSRTIAIATTAGAVLLAAGGVASFVVAGDVQSDAEKKICPTRESCDDERQKVRTFDALALAGFVSAAALGTFAVVLWTARPSTSGKSAPALVARGPWLGLEGRF
jgi:hypothetical protein